MLLRRNIALIKRDQGRRQFNPPKTHVGNCANLCCQSRFVHILAQLINQQLADSKKG